MGAHVWDSRFVNDAEIHYSAVYFHKARILFEMHRELVIPNGKVHSLARALTSDQLFRTRVPSFLKYYLAHEKSPPATAFGLKELAGLIKSGALSGSTEWRFGISPIPRPIRGKSPRRYFLEIRLDLDPATAFAKDKLTREQLAAAIRQLKPAKGRATAKFLAAIDKLATANNHMAGPFLRSVFRRPLPTPKR